jgi:hypothetical protein
MDAASNVRGAWAVRLAPTASIAKASGIRRWWLIGTFPLGCEQSLPSISPRSFRLNSLTIGPVDSSNFPGAHCSQRALGRLLSAARESPPTHVVSFGINLLPA